MPAFPCNPYQAVLTAVVGGAEVITCDTLGGEKGGELHYTTKAECHGNRERCIACCLMTEELFKIEAAAAAEYSESIFRLGAMRLTLAAEALLGFAGWRRACARVRVHVRVVGGTWKCIRVEINLACCAEPRRKRDSVLTQLD